MPSNIAKLFNNGGIQAVRLPAEFRFDGDEVFIRRDSLTGDVILSKRTGWSTWDEFFALRDEASVPEDYLSERALDGPFELPDLFRDV